MSILQIVEHWWNRPRIRHFCVSPSSCLPSLTHSSRRRPQAGDGEDGLSSVSFASKVGIVVRGKRKRENVWKGGREGGKLKGRWLAWPEKGGSERPKEAFTYDVYTGWGRGSRRRRCRNGGCVTYILYSIRGCLGAKLPPPAILRRCVAACHGPLRNNFEDSASAT